jgi:hypothetical protein
MGKPHPIAFPVDNHRQTKRLWAFTAIRAIALTSSSRARSVPGQIAETKSLIRASLPISPAQANRLPFVAFRDYQCRIP